MDENSCFCGHPLYPPPGVRPDQRMEAVVLPCKCKAMHIGCVSQHLRRTTERHVDKVYIGTCPFCRQQAYSEDAVTTDRWKELVATFDQHIPNDDDIVFIDDHEPQVQAVQQQQHNQDEEIVFLGVADPQTPPPPQPQVQQVQPVQPQVQQVQAVQPAPPMAVDQEIATAAAAEVQAVVNGDGGGDGDGTLAVEDIMVFN